jgi:formamidase
VISRRLIGGVVTVPAYAERVAVVSSPVMSRPLSVLGFQLRPVSYDPAATLDRFEGYVNLARREFPGSDLYLFPELYLTGEDPFTLEPPKDFVHDVAEEIPGPLTDRVGKMAAKVRRWIVAGSTFEREGREVYNTALVFSPDGDLVTTYRKLFPWEPFETSTPGDAPPPVFDIPGIGRAGLMICYDGWFPEVARGLALRGAEVILHPTLTSTPDREDELVLARANAVVNQCYVVNINMGDTIGGGRSIAVDPEGRVLYTAGAGEELLPEILDLERTAEVRERGSRGITSPLRHFREGPAAVMEPYAQRREGSDREAADPIDRS